MRFCPGDLLTGSLDSPASPRELIDVALSAELSHGTGWYDVMTAERGEIHRALSDTNLRDSSVAVRAP